MLDVVSYQDPLVLSKDTNPYRPIAAAPFYLPPEKGYKRDHCIIGSPPLETKPFDAYTRVQNFLACQLYTLSPKLSLAILALNPERQCSKKRLLAIYQQYFSPKGTFLSLLEQYIWFAKQKPQALANTKGSINSPACITEKHHANYAPSYFQKEKHITQEKPAKQGLVPGKD